jgi:hypothetical protein
MVLIESRVSKNEQITVGLANPASVWWGWRGRPVPDASHPLRCLPLCFWVLFSRIKIERFVEYLGENDEMRKKRCLRRKRWVDQDRHAQDYTLCTIID